MHTLVNALLVVALTLAMPVLAAEPKAADKPAAAGEIKPGAALVFEVELLEITPAGELPREGLPPGHP